MGGTLMAKASYFDGESAVGATTKKIAMKIADNDVELDTRNKAPVFDLDEDEDTSDRAERHGHQEGGGEHRGASRRRR